MSLRDGCLRLRRGFLQRACGRCGCLKRAAVQTAATSVALLQTAVPQAQIAAPQEHTASS
ncbi:MAG TPA: hypothetical protein DCF92_10515 [Idiomarina sp.]|nr:hypothetical protein [Idiomarina sp.]